MSEQTLDPRIRSWLDDGPRTLPHDLLERALATTDGVAQGSTPRVLGRPVQRRALLLAATVGLLALLVGAAFVGGLFRTPGPTVDLLAPYPDATRLFDRQGGPEPAASTPRIEGLPAEGAFVLVASCTGPGSVAIERHDRTIDFDPEQVTPGDDPQLVQDARVPCGGDPTTLAFDAPAGEITLDVPAGVAWQVSVGRFEDLPAQPAFGQLLPTDGYVFVQPVGGVPELLILRRMGLGIQVPEGVDHIAVLVACDGDPLRVGPFDGEAAAELPCDSATTVERVVFETTGLSTDVELVSTGITWFMATPEAPATPVEPPSAVPDLPDGYEAMPYVESDGSYLVVGALGTGDTAQLPLPMAEVGLIGGDVVGVTHQAVPGTETLELRSVATGEVLVSITSADPETMGLYPGPVDATNGWLYYGTLTEGPTLAYRRVRLDGSGDELVVEMAPGWSVPPRGVLAVDDSVFVVDRCEGGTCVRTIADPAPGAIREVVIEGSESCWLVGATAEVVVASSADRCTDQGGGALTAQPLEGGERRVLAEAAGSEVLVRTPDGPVVVASTWTESSTTTVAIDVATGTLVPLFEEADGASTRTARERTHPVGEWVVLGVVLAHPPTQATVETGPPLLVNVRTGETIELTHLAAPAG